MVSVDDPKAVFLIQWYQECDDDGLVLTGFQHPCHGFKYHLPMFGDALEHVVEVSNHVVLESVEMEKDSNFQAKSFQKCRGAAGVGWRQSGDGDGDGLGDGGGSRREQ